MSRALANLGMSLRIGALRLVQSPLVPISVGFLLLPIEHFLWDSIRFSGKGNIPYGVNRPYGS